MVVCFGEEVIVQTRLIFWRLHLKFAADKRA
jgi:hypothetical protein